MSFGGFTKKIIVNIRTAPPALIVRKIGAKSAGIAATTNAPPSDLDGLFSETLMQNHAILFGDMHPGRSG